MCNRTVLLLSLIVIGNLNGIRTESECSSNYQNSKMCDLIDNEIRPCDDFYKFACGKYMKEKAKVYVFGDVLEDVEDANKQNFLEILKKFSEIKDKKDINSHYKLATDLYKSCMNTEKKGLHRFLDLINLNGGWPLLTFSKTNTDISSDKTKVLLKKGFNVDPILKMTYVPASQNSTAEFILERPSFYVPDSNMNANSTYGRSMIRVVDEFLPGNRSWSAIVEILAFERKLYNMMGQRKAYKSLTIDQMEHQYREVMKYIRPFLEPYIILNSDIQIVLLPTKYFDELETLLSATEDDTISNYLIWRFLLAVMQYLLPPVNENESEEWCLDQVYKLLPMVIHKMYIQEYIKSFEKKMDVVHEIVKNIRQEFIEMIQETEWMDEEAKVKTIQRLQAVPVFVKHRKLFNELANLPTLELKPDNFLLNVLRIMLYRKEFQVLNNPRVPAPWLHAAQYDPARFSIYVSPGLLEWPAFLLYGSSYFNYGSLGSIIAHEFGHSLDVNNYYDYNIGRREDNWLKQTKIEYSNRVACFSNQYSSIVVEPGLNLNGRKTISEDMADNLGVKVAYRAYRKLTKGNQQSHGLWDYTDRQLFWISMAQYHCNSIDPSEIKNIILKTIYTMSRFRVDGIDANGRGLLYRNIFDCFIKTFKIEAMRGLYKGFVANYWRAAPHTILNLTFWEQFKKWKDLYLSEEANIYFE